MYELTSLPLDRLLKLNPVLTRTADQDKLTEAIRLYGVSMPIVNRETMRLLTSRQELQTAAALRAAGEPPPRGISHDWQLTTILGQWSEHDESRAALRFAGGIDHALTGQPDTEQLMNILLQYDESDFDHLAGIGLTIDEYSALLDAIIEPGPAIEPPAAILPTGWGIPVLDHWLQADKTPAPVIKWGSIGRTEEAGTVHFYTDDYKFMGLVEQPDKLLKTRCKAAVELNLSTSPYMPRALALYGIYQKRAVSRAWQEAGIKIIVDLNIEPEFFDLALLGIPTGWRAYANRWHGDSDHLTQAHALATDHAGGPVFYTVYGGGQDVKDFCESHGWHWLPEQAQAVRGLWDADAENNTL